MNSAASASPGLLSSGRRLLPCNAVNLGRRVDNRPRSPRGSPMACRGLLPHRPCVRRRAVPHGRHVAGGRPSVLRPSLEPAWKPCFAVLCLRASGTTVGGPSAPGWQGPAGKAAARRRAWKARRGRERRQPGCGGTRAGSGFSSRLLAHGRGRPPRWAGWRHAWSQLASQADLVRRFGMLCPLWARCQP
jgi:hypothetical protein